jgi:hypothetical protein
MSLPVDAFSVLVFDLAHMGEPDAERRVDGFATVTAARAYAEARIRASVEELRAKEQTPCPVLGDGFRGRDQLDRYIATPASIEEQDWAALAPVPPTGRCMNGQARLL